MNAIFPENYFVDGGTLRANTPSYVTRPADEELFRALLAGEYCYVLTPRQMGKSSLMIHTSQRLKERNVKTAIVDIQRIGTDKVKEWYGSMLSQIRRGLGLKVDTDAWMSQRSNIGYGELFVQFVQDVVLVEIKDPVVIFFDEVDWLIKLGFRDDFFASIRAIYNARAQYSELSRISFVLLGVAAPADLIAEPTRTPFNIGHAIPLQELSFEDADPLQKGLDAIYPNDGARILERIFYWTNGHPYLTQKICKAVVEAPEANWSNEAVDALVNELFLSEESRKEANLKFIQDRVLSSEQYGELLKFYKRSLRSRVKENGQSVIQNQLMLSGLLTSEDGFVKVRNRVYQTVFDEKWIDQNMPKDWQRTVNIALGIVLGVLIVAFTVISISDGVHANRIFRYRGDFFAARNNQSTREQVASLANIFRTKGIIRELGEDVTARSLFFNELKTIEEQQRLFTDYKELGSETGALLKDAPELQEDLIVIIKGIYYSLALTDPTHDNTDLLKAMQNALSQFTGETSNALKKEIGHWIISRESISKARALANDDEPANDLEIQTEYQKALNNYGEAIRVNSKNPALYFERALVYVRMRDPLGTNDSEVGDKALKDLNTVISIVGISSSQDVTPQPSGTVTFSTTNSYPVTSGLESQVSETGVPVSINVDEQTTPSPSAIRTATRRPEVVILTQTLSTSPPSTPTRSTSATLTATPAPFFSPTPTLTPLPEKFRPGFFKGGDVFDIPAEVEHVLRQNPWLGNILAANPGKYTNLQAVGLATIYPTLSPTPIPTATFTPTLIVPNLALAETITEANAANVTQLGQLGKGAIREAVYAPDGKIFAVASSLGIYFYDSASLGSLGAIETTDGVSHLAFSRDGLIVASSLDNNNILFWDVSNRVQVGRVLSGHSGSITSMEFSLSDGELLLASASEDNTVRIWRFRDGVLIQTIDHPDVVRSVTFSPDGRTLASASLDPDSEDENDRVWLWNVPAGDKVVSERVAPIQAFSTFGSSNVAFSPDGQILAAGSEDDAIRLWRLSDGQFINTAEGGSADMAFSPDGKSLAAISFFDSTVKLFDASDNRLKLVASLTEHTDAVLNVTFSPDSKTLLSTSADNTVRLWDRSSGTLLQVLEDHVISPYIAISPDGKLIACGAEDGSIYLWRLSEGKIISTLKGHTASVRSLAFSSDGLFVASGSDDATVRIWDVADGNLRYTFTGHTSNVFTVAFAPMQHWLISGSADGTIRIWNADDGSSWGAVVASQPTYTVYSVAFSPNIYPIVLGLGEPEIGFTYEPLGFNGPYAIRFLTGQNSVPPGPFLGHTNSVRAVAYSSDGSVIASGSDDNTVRLWLTDGTRLAVLSGHSDTVRNVGFSSDEAGIIASASYDGTIRLWSVNSGSILKTLTGHQAEIYSMAFSPGGKFIVSGSPDGTIRLWGISP